MGFFFTLVLYAVSFVLSELLRPKPKIENAKPAGLGDFDFPTATEGRHVPLLWGTVQIAGPNVIWYGDLETVPITVRQKTGLFSSERIITGFKYYMGVQLGWSRGECDSLRKVWIGDDEVFSGNVTDGNVASINEPDLFGGNKLGQGGFIGDLRFFAGSETQAVSGYLSSRTTDFVTLVGAGSGYTAQDIVTVSGGVFTTAATIRILTVGGGGDVLTAELEDSGYYTTQPTNPASVTGGTGTGATFNLAFNAAIQPFPGGVPPAYRGTCFGLLEHAYVGNSTSIKPIKVELRRIVPGPATASFESIDSGNDCNPVNVLYEAMTNTEWGRRIPAGDIDTTSFSDAGTVLHGEGNGFSMLLDRGMEVKEFIDLVQDQIDGLVFQNHLTGKWQIKLARGGYTVGSLPLLSPATISEMKSFSRGSWKETTNQVHIEFVDRADNYKTTFAPAQDMANIKIQNGVTNTVSPKYSGVKNRTLANAIAWRELRTLSYPIAKAQLVVDRSFYATLPGDVLALTLPDLEIALLPMRVTRVDLGEITDNRITLDLVEDVFVSRAGSFIDPPPSAWDGDQPEPNAFSSADQLAFEAPRGFSLRDLGAPTDRVWAGGKNRPNSTAVGFAIMERHAAGATSGAYVFAGEGFQFLQIGRLDSSMAVGTVVPSASFIVRSSPSTQADLLASIVAVGTPVQLGNELTNLILIDDELMLVTSSQVGGGSTVQFNTVYRGVLDTVQAAHGASARVYVLSAGGVLTETGFVPTDNVDIKLLPETPFAQTDISAASNIALTMANRIRRPYPPASVDLNGTYFATTVDLEGTGSGPETWGFLAHMLRRDFRTVDEVAALSADAADIFADYPAANTTTHEVDVRTTGNTLLFTLTTGTRDATALRLRLLKELNGVLPASLRVRLRSLHLVDAVSYTSRYDLVWDFTVTTDLTGQFNFGARAANVASNVYTATTAGTFAFTLSSAFTAGDVEYRLNGGAWLPLITAGTTSGNILAVVATDTIEIRHTSTDTAALKQLDMNAAGAGQDAYAVLYT